VPLEVVRTYNARYRGRETALTHDAAIVETASNQVVSEVISAVEDRGLSLSRRSRVARTFGTVVFVVYLALVLLSLVVLAVAATNIAHTFALLVHERRREIAVLRALGASQLDVAGLVLGEAALLGLGGGLLGVGLARLAALAVDRLAGLALAGVPLVPEAFFDFPEWIVPLGAGVAVVFCVLGALAPALRASRLDPAAVLAQP
jgi:ABC-type antimicrobial peptide transport system permease subunit